jgi:hypothetical protein
MVIQPSSFWSSFLYLPYFTNLLSLMCIANSTIHLVPIENVIKSMVEGIPWCVNRYKLLKKFHYGTWRFIISAESPLVLYCISQTANFNIILPTESWLSQAFFQTSIIQTQNFRGLGDHNPGSSECIFGQIVDLTYIKVQSQYSYFFSLVEM